MLDFSANLLGKRKAEAEEKGPKATIVIISIFDPKEDIAYGVAALLTGDLYAIRDAIKKCPTEECVINGETLPMVSDCLKAKYISRELMARLIREIPTPCKDLGKYSLSGALR